jgi:beta-glucanase (GH16 family)
MLSRRSGRLVLFAAVARAHSQLRKHALLTVSVMLMLMPAQLAPAQAVVRQAGPGTAVAGGPVIDTADWFFLATNAPAVATAVAAGSYSVSSFAFETGSATGTVRPFLARLSSASPRQYEVVWVGPAVAGNAAAVGAPVTANYAANTQSFTLSAAGDLFGGFYTVSGARVRFVGGSGTTDVGRVATPFSTPNFNTSGADLATITYPALARAYRFAIKFSAGGSAPPPTGVGDANKPVTLDLTGYRLTFSDEFNGPLDVSSRGPNTKWIAHTPYNGDFGDAWFTDPTFNPSPFSISNGILSITARYDQVAKHWRSGLLASVDTRGNGYTLQYGYVEMRAKFPRGPGTWPAFWMVDRANVVGNVDGFEADVVEQYGRRPQELSNVWHQWFANGSHAGAGKTWTVEDMSLDFHTYGFMWDANTMVWYYDGKEMWRLPTFPQAKQPLYLMVNLALGAGWPIDQTPNPSVMYVDYVRAYQKN